VYRKASWVLHMLRHVLGDSIFFRSLKSYLETALPIRVATTEDFQHVCEIASGMSLGYFFDEWITGRNTLTTPMPGRRRPAPAGTRIRNDQPSDRDIESLVFTMPVDFKVSAPGWDTTVVLFNTFDGQGFVFNVSHSPVSVELDPENWILRDIVQGPRIHHRARHFSGSPWNRISPTRSIPLPRSSTRCHHRGSSRCRCSIYSVDR